LQVAETVPSLHFVNPVASQPAAPPCLEQQPFVFFVVVVVLEVVAAGIVVLVVVAAGAVVVVVVELVEAAGVAGAFLVVLDLLGGVCEVPPEHKQDGEVVPSLQRS